jgi:hypothetical protein
MKTLIILLCLVSIAYAENKALVFEGKVVQIEEVTFPVAPALKWVECGDDVEVGWGYDGVSFIEPVQEPAPIVYNADEFIAWCMANVLTPELQPHYFALLSAANKDAKGGWDNFIAYCNMVGQSELGQTIINEAELRGANV